MFRRKKRGPHPEISRPVALEVNYDKPKWRIINSDDYLYVMYGLGVDRFPIKGKGVGKASFVRITLDRDYPCEQIISLINEQGFNLPDRPESETYMDALSESKAKLALSPVVAFCGTPTKFIGKQQDYPYVEINENGITIAAVCSSREFLKGTRILAIVSRE